MTAIAEVLDLLKVVADGIGNVRTVVEAARDGEKFLRTHYPDAEKDLADLLDEIGKLTEYLADASSIITGFAFTVTGSDVDRQPRAFNDLLVQRQAVFARFDNQLQLTRTHCSRIDDYGDALLKKAQERGLHNLFGLLNAGSEQAQRMSDLVLDVWTNDQTLLREFKSMSEAVRRALDDVQAALGPPGQMLIENVPAAAALLGEYSTAFVPIQLEADEVKRELHALVNDLRPPQPIG